MMYRPDGNAKKIKHQYTKYSPSLIHEAGGSVQPLLSQDLIRANTLCIIMCKKYVITVFW